MSKKNFIALGQAIMEHNRVCINRGSMDSLFDPSHLDTLAQFCQSQNPRFLRERWLGFINGQNGPCGGSVKGAR
jgi:hypothetical protein